MYPHSVRKNVQNNEAGVSLPAISLYTRTDCSGCGTADSAQRITTIEETLLCTGYTTLKPSHL